MTFTFGSRRRPPLVAGVRARLRGVRGARDASIGNHGSGGQTGGGGGNDGPTNVDPGKVTAPTTPFDAKTAFYATSKVKNLLTGLPVTDDDVAKVTAKGAAGLQELVSTWMTKIRTRAPSRRRWSASSATCSSRRASSRRRTSRSSCCRTAASTSQYPERR